MKFRGIFRVARLQLFRAVRRFLVESRHPFCVASFNLREPPATALLVRGFEIPGLLFETFGQFIARRLGVGHGCFPFLIEFLGCGGVRQADAFSFLCKIRRSLPDAGIVKLPCFLQRAGSSSGAGRGDDPGQKTNRNCTREAGAENRPGFSRDRLKIELAQFRHENEGAQQNQEYPDPER